MTTGGTADGDTVAGRNLFDELLEIRDRQRAAKRRAVIKVDDLPWELNRHGFMKWYMHPNIEDTAHQAELIYLQRIPAGSRSGRQQQQGGAVIYILSGRGHTVLDGERFSWAADDCLQLPIREDGVVFQHFNDDPERDVELLYVEASLVQPLGVDRGARFEELVDAPEFGAS